MSMRVPRHLARVVSAILVPCYLAACYSWAQPAGSVSPAQVLEGQPEAVRVTLRTGQRIELKKVSVAGDSLVGVGRSGMDRGLQVRLALADIAQVEVPRVNNAKTLAVVPVVALGVGLVALMVAVAVCDPSGFSLC